MPGFHVPDGLDDVKIKIQEQLPVRCPLSLTGHIGSSWIIWFMWILKSNGVLSAFVRRELYPARMFQCMQKVPVKLGVPPVTLWWPHQSGAGSVPELKSWWLYWFQFYVLKLDCSDLNIYIFQESVLKNLSIEKLENRKLYNLWKFEIENKFRSIRKLRIEIKIYSV